MLQRLFSPLDMPAERAICFADNLKTISQRPIISRSTTPIFTIFFSPNGRYLVVDYRPYPVFPGIFHYYSLGGNNIVMLGGLHARLCHALLVLFYFTQADGSSCDNSIHWYFSLRHRSRICRRNFCDGSRSCSRCIDSSGSHRKLLYRPPQRSQSLPPQQ